jgi:phosphoribosylanthranilate isomerase
MQAVDDSPVQHPRTRFKLCGMTSVADAELAVSLGAWAIGLILWPGSKRACDPAVGVRISAAVRRKVEVVGVFVNQEMDEVAALADMLQLSMIQLHGDEGPSYATEIARRTGCKVIKAQRVKLAADVVQVQAFRTEFHLLDTFHEELRGGTGETFEWDTIRRRTSDVPLILSGGLNAENVVAAIEAVHPFAVDVASGIEASPGVKDPEKMKAFAEAVKSTWPAGSDARPPTPTTAPASTPTPAGRRAPVRPTA